VSVQSEAERLLNITVRRLRHEEDSGTIYKIPEMNSLIQGCPRTAARLMQHVETRCMARGVPVTYDENPAFRYGGYHVENRTIGLAPVFDTPAMLYVLLHEFIHSIDPDVQDDFTISDMMHGIVRRIEVETEIATKLLCDDVGLETEQVVIEYCTANLRLVQPNFRDERKMVNRTLWLYQQATQELRLLGVAQAAAQAAA
jgi:hypothetical protein